MIDETNHDLPCVDRIDVGARGDGQLAALERAEHLLPNHAGGAIGSEEPRRCQLLIAQVNQPARSVPRGTGQPRRDMHRPRVNGLAEEREVQGLAREDAQEFAVRKRDARAAAARFEGDGVDGLAVAPIGPLAQDLQRPPGHAAAAGFFSRMAAVHQRHARPLLRQVARRHRPGRARPGDHRVEHSHQTLA